MTGQVRITPLTDNAKFVLENLRIDLPPGIGLDLSALDKDHGHVTGCEFNYSSEDATTKAS